MLNDKYFVRIYVSDYLVAECSCKFFSDWLLLNFSKNDYAFITSCLNLISIAECRGYEFKLVERD